MSKLGDSNTIFLGTLTWANITSKPTTLSGYGITDALSTSGGTLTGDLTINKDAGIIEFNHPTTSSYNQISFKDNGVQKGYITNIGSTNATVWSRNSIDIGATHLLFSSNSEYIGIYGNTINGNPQIDANAGLWVNYTGYNRGTTQFRDFAIGNGKAEVIASFIGSDKSVTFYGNTLKCYNGDGITLYQNEIIGNYNANTTASFWINYSGYQAGLTQFRDLYIGNGKGSTVAYFRGSDKLTALYGAVNITGNITAPNITYRDSISLTSINATGWWRVATSPSGEDHLSGLFSITSAISGYHQQTRFTASGLYGQQMQINQLMHSYYTSAPIVAVRIVYHATYSGNYAYLELYCSTAPITGGAISVIDNIGWSFITPTAGSIPSGYTSVVMYFGGSLAVSNSIGVRGSESTKFTLQTGVSTNDGVRTNYYKSRGSIDSPTVITSGDYLSTDYYYGYEGTNYIESASILVQSTGTIATNRVASDIIFRTHPDSTSACREVVRFKSDAKSVFSGDVSIQNSTTEHNLILNDNNSASSSFIIARSDSGSLQLVRRKSDQTGNLGLSAGCTEFISTGNYDFGIGTYTGTGSLILGTNNTQRFKISGDGSLINLQTYGDGLYLNGGNEINFGYNINSHANSYINYSGYANGATQWRSLFIYNGARQKMMSFDAVNQLVHIHGSASNANKTITFGDSNGIWFDNGTDSDTNGWINYFGYNKGITRYRGLYIGNGKGSTLAYFNGTDSSTTFYGNISTSGSLFFTSPTTDKTFITNTSYAGGVDGGNGTYTLSRFMHGYWGSTQEVASIKVIATSSNAGSGYGYGALAFYTGSSGNGDVGSTSAQRLYIDSSGNSTFYGNSTLLNNNNYASPGHDLYLQLSSNYDAQDYNAVYGHRIRDYRQSLTGSDKHANFFIEQLKYNGSNINATAVITIEGNTGNTTLIGGFKASNDFNVLANGTATEVRIGGTAKTWTDNFDVLQVNNTVFFNDVTTTRLMRNVYYNGGYIRSTTDYVEVMVQGNGNHYFNCAVSGNAGTSINPFTTSFQTGISGNAFGTPTLKTWVGCQAVQLGGLGAIYGDDGETAGNSSGWSNNAYFSSTGWKRKIADEASVVAQANGDTVFYYTASSTADSAITWTKSFQTGISGNCFSTTTPKTWHASYPAIQVGGLGAVMSEIGESASKDTFLVHNAYVWTTSETWRYKINDEACFLRFHDGNMYYNYGDGGSADSAVTTITTFQTGKSGTTFYQNVTLPNDPTSAMHCATKQYVDSVASGALLANTYKNHAVDGGFNIAQTATSATNPTAQTYPVCDMWKVAEYASVLPTLVHSQQKVTPEELYGAHYFYRINSNGNGTSPSSATLSTFIENGVRNLFGSGKTITVSFYAKTSITGKKIGIMLYNSYGTGGSPSSPFDINGTTFTLTSSWTKYSYTFTTTSLSGVTFGTNNDDYICPMIYYAWNEGNGARVGAGGTVEYFGNGNIEFAKFKVNVGSTATEFEQEDVKDVLPRVQRYLHPILTTSECGLTGFALYSTVMYTRFTFRCTMRIAPSLLRVGGSSTIARTVQFNSSFGISGTPTGTCTIYDSTTDFTSFAITGGPIAGVINIEVDLIGTGISAYFLDARF